MLWIREVEMVDSVDDLKTSRSIGAHRFPNFEMLDAKIASSLKKITTNPYFKKKDNLEEQKAQMQDRILRGRQIAFLIYECFRTSVSLYMATISKIQMHDGTRLCYQQVKYRKTVFWKVCTKCEYERLIHSKQYWQCTHKKSIKFDQSRAIRSCRPSE